MSLPNIIKKFSESKNILDDLEKLEDGFGNKFVDLFKIDNFSYWELSKPILNLHVIPGINSKSYLYSLISLAFRVIKRLLSSKGFNENHTKKNNSKTDILCVGFTEYINKDIFKPFISELNKKINLDNVLFINEYNSKEKIEYDCKTIDINSHAYVGFNKDIKSILKKIPKNRDIIKFYCKKGVKNTKSENLSNYEVFKIFYWLKYIFIPKYIPYVLLSEKIILNTSPNCILEADIADPRNRAFIMNAKKYAISTYTLQFAFYNRDSYEWFYALSDKIFVWGSWFLNLFNKNFEIDRKRMVVIGSPRFDKLSETFLNNHFVEKNKKVILIISSYEVKSYKNVTKTISFKKYICTLIETLIKDGYKIYIKIHPLEKEINYLDKYLDNGLSIVSFDNFHSVLKKVKVVLTHGSTLTFDALIMNKIICYPTDKNIVWWDDIFLQNNLGFGFDSYNDLIILLRQINEQSSFTNRNISEFIYYQDNNNASIRIFDYLFKNKIF
jgi:hypothetical protein